MGVTNKTDGKSSSGSGSSSTSSSSASSASSSSWSSNSSSRSKAAAEEEPLADKFTQRPAEDDFKDFQSHDKTGSRDYKKDQLGGSRFYFGLGVALVFAWYVYYSYQQIPHQLELERDAALERQRRTAQAQQTQKSPFDEA
ncbi:protein AF-9 [Aedes aegypti]|uniref:Uncharacterized protein n=1 Tax=Aedes aegypti TaxID=7159 RepID=A0A6I8U6P3_AEDAE|nr:protein AF-9 [Aedes aegypti]